MTAAPLTELQREALLSLHLGWRWGIDFRTVRGLLMRGLVYTWTHHIWHPDHVSEIELPALTAEGAVAAARLWLELPLEQKAEIRAVFAKWGLVPDEALNRTAEQRERAAPREPEFPL